MKQQSDITNHIVRTEETVGHINYKLDKIDKRFDELDRKFDEAAKKIDQRLDKADARTWTNFYWLLGSMFSLASALVGIMAKGFKWL